MIKQVLFGACADTWCSVHSLRLHGSRVCPKCPPRVVDQLGTTFDRELPTCKHGFHECRMCNEGAQQESGSEPEGADRAKREGWWWCCDTTRSTDAEWMMYGVDNIVVTYADDDVSFQAWRKDNRGRWMCNIDPRPTLLEAQLAAEQLAADTRENWRAVNAPSARSYEMIVGRFGAPTIVARVFSGLVAHSDTWVGSHSGAHPSAITAMLACERALEQRS